MSTAVNKAFMGATSAFLVLLCKAKNPKPPKSCVGDEFIKCQGAVVYMSSDWNLG